MITMKPYIATFAHTGERTRYVRCDGISDAHAQARAWIKHMGSLVYKSNENGWELLELKEL